MITEQELIDMGFIKSGILTTGANGQFVFDSQGISKKVAPGVYLWLHRKDGLRHNVMYAGKAGSGVVIRMSQHIGGLKSAPIERVERVKNAFGQGNCLEIWFRQSAKIAINALYDGEVSAYSTEEEALITRFLPELNRAKTPAMRAEPKEPVKTRVKVKTEAKSETNAEESAQKENGFIPTDSQEENPVFIALDYEITNANGKQRDLWEDAKSTLTTPHKQKIGKVLGLLSHSAALRDQWPELDCKVVGLYTAGPIRNQSMLVFGKLAKTIFKTGSQAVRISLEKELIAFSPDITANMPVPPDIDGAYSLDACIRMLSER